MKKYALTFMSVMMLTAAIAFAAQTLTNYGSTPTLQIPSLNYQGWGTVVNNNLKALVDFLGVAHNSDGTLKSTTTASQWTTGSTAVTYIDADSFKVPDADGTVFVAGRKVWVNQAVDVIGAIASTSSSGGETTVNLNLIVLYSDNATGSTLTTPITSVSVGIDTLRSDPSPKNTGRGGYINLVVKRASVSTVDIDADSITLATTTTTYDALSVNETCTISSSGANGLDTGLEANSTFYSVWVIYDGTNVDCLLSVSATTPTMPSGYTYKRRVGWVYNNSSGDLWNTRQQNETVTHVFGRDTYITSTSGNYVLCSPIVPTTAIVVIATSAGTNVADISYDGTNLAGSLEAGGSSGISNITYIALDSNQQHYGKRYSASGNFMLMSLGWIDAN